jgi:hypothetical protein
MTPAPTDTPTPAPTPTVTPTPTPVLRRLIGGGCCTQPFWSPDSRHVLFIDRPNSASPLGIWGVDVTAAAPTPELFTERIAFYTDDMAYIIETKEETTVIENASDGTRWEIPAAAGQRVEVSPGRERVAWELTNHDIAFELRKTQVWVADFDGSNAQKVATLNRGGMGGWVTDDALLLSGRDSLELPEQSIFILSLTDGSTVELVRGDRIRSGVLSPGGEWFAYYVAFDEDPEENGTWLVRVDGTKRQQLPREMFGAYKWRDSNRLLIIPFRPDAQFHELWEVDAETLESRRLTDPESTPFKIANADWTVSPDGKHVAFVESADRNIWLLTLP